MKKQSASILNSLKRFNSDRKIAGKHPLRQLIPERPVHISFFQGIVLAALCDDGKISLGEQEHLRNLGLSLSLSEDDVEDSIDTVKKIRSTKDQTAFLTEVVESLSDPMAAMLFLCEFIVISNAPDHDRKELQPYIEAFAEELKLANAKMFFQTFCAFASAEGKARTAAAADVRKNCPEAFLPFLPYFLTGLEEPDKDSLLTDMESLMDKLSGDMDENNAKALKDFLSQFLKSHPEISKYQLMHMLLPVVKQEYQSLKKAINRLEGKGERWNSSRVYCETDTAQKFLRYVCLMDLLTVCNEDFMMIRALQPQKYISWTSVREPEDVAKANVIDLYGRYVKELEERCK